MQDELKFPGTMKIGDNGPGVKRIQEWLCLQDRVCAIDGEFGPATEAAVKAFTARYSATGYGLVNNMTWNNLTPLMREALVSLELDGTPLGFGALICHYAKQHLNSRPREVGGENRGPWVRLYCRGAETLWCAGFVSTIIAQAAAPDKTPLTFTLSCDALAAEARALDLFMDGRVVMKNGIDIQPGSVFLIRKSQGDWIHTGIVISSTRQVIETIEGNTNDDGSREGYEVARRHRKITEKIDYVVWK